MPSREATELLHTGDMLRSWSGAKASEASQELVGATLNGTYVVERLLGEGGMGRVFLARHTRISQKRVAIKVLHGRLVGNEQVRARFQREAEAAAAISHPNVVAVLDVDTTPEGMPYLVCEYLEGRDLSDHLGAVERLNVPDAVSITRQLCRGLAAAHARGVIHRDLKPPNVFLVGDFRAEAPPPLFAKILDFGLSRFREGQHQNLTEAGLILGTPSYMPPEQARGQHVDHRADVYGVGALLYALLTGRAPFQEDSPQATILALLGSEPPRPSSLVDELPPHVEQVILRAMAKDPERRFPDMVSFERALDALPSLQVLAAVPRAAGAVPPASSARRPARAETAEASLKHARRRLLVALLSAGVLSLGVGGLSISGVELARGQGFDRFSLGLAALGVVVASAGPALLGLVYARRRLWLDRPRLQALGDQVRAAVIAGGVSYGLLLLTLRLFDELLSRLASPALPPLGAAWQGWNLLLAAAALVSAGAAAERQRLLNSVRPGWRRLGALGVITCVAAATIVTLLYFGVAWHARSSGP